MQTLKKYLIPFIATIVLTIGLTSIAQAAVNTALTFPTCALSIHPYKVGGTYVDEYDNQWYNKFVGGSFCNSHLSYPNQYNPQPPVDSENQLQSKTGVENIYAPDTIHHHVYHNASLEEQDSTPADNFWYRSWMAKFQIILENDALIKTDKYNVICGTPIGSNQYHESSCDTTIPYWGDTKISFNKTTGVITWDFAEQSSKKGRPWFWGENPSLGKTHGYFGAYVKLVSKNNPEEIWTATTTSRTLVRDQALLKWSEDDDASDGDTVNDGDAPVCANDGIPNATKDFNGNWCTTNPPNFAGVEGPETNDGKQYYWYRIGVVGTVWKKPPPENLAVCANLDLEITQNGITYTPATVNNGLNPLDSMHLEVTPTFTPTNESVPLQYKWSSFLVNKVYPGKFWDGVSIFSSENSSPFTDNINDTFVRYEPETDGSSAGTTISVIAIDDNVEQTQCQASFVIPEVPVLPMCESIDLDPDYVNAPGQTAYQANVTFDDGIDYLTEVTWTGNGNFSNGTTQEHLSNTSFDNTFDTSSDTATVNVSVTDLPSGVLNSPACQAGETVYPKDDWECENLAVTVTPSGPIYEGDTVYVEIDSLTYDPTAPTPHGVIWSTNGGSFVNTAYMWTANPYFGICPVSPDPNTSYPIFCSYNYTAVNAGDTFTLTASPNPTNTPACEYTREVEPPDTSLKCDYLEWIEPDPLELNISGNTNLAVKVHYTDGNDYTTTVGWNSSGGNLDTSSETHTSLNNFLNIFSLTSTPASATAAVTAATDNNGDPIDIADCATPIEVTTEDYNCEDIDLYTNGNQTCIDVDGGYTGPFTWTINGSDHELPQPSCINIPDDALWSVYATDEPNNAACQADNDYECEDIEVDQGCVEVTEGVYDGDFTWIVGNEPPEVLPQNQCAVIPPNTEWEVFATEEPDNEDCQDNDTYNPEYELTKRVKKTSGGDYTMDVLTLQSTHDSVYYQIQFTPGMPGTTATITDTIGLEGGRIDAELRPDPNTLDLTQEELDSIPDPGYLEYVNESMYITEESYGELENCTTKYAGADPAVPVEDWEHCYVGDIGNSGGVVLHGVYDLVKIEYELKVYSSLTPEVCKHGIICEEIYKNISYGEDIEDENGDEYDDLESNEILLQIFCQYILTRAAGDIFLENALSVGVDINVCSEYTTSTGLVITPGDETTPDLIKSGADDGVKIFEVGHEICKQGQEGEFENSELAELYGSQIFGNISSQICEVKLRTGSPWKQEVITNSIEENKTRISRWFPDNNGSLTIETLQELPNFNDQSVIRIDGDLTIGNSSTTNPTVLSDGEGAKTIIVNGGNLRINKDIMYGACISEPCNVRDIASLAFIVLDGSISIDKDVESISGVFFVQEGDNNNSGRLFSKDGEVSTKPLKVYGSIYGDIDPLFTNRVYAGDPSEDSGGIVIRFDQRVILNTPQGLRDIIDLSQTEY